MEMNMKTIVATRLCTVRICTVVMSLALGLAACSGEGSEGTMAAAGGQLDRSVLPIAEPSYPPITELDARDATPPPRFDVEAPEGAPNVVIVLIDDIGFGHASTFGGPINTPTLDRLAAGGLRYNRFHTTALCSPTRMALLTGRNHHVTNTGAIMELATAFPGNTGVRPQSVAPLAEMLRLNGYSTAAFGKYHETAPWEVSVSGPYDRWPTRSGFDKFYGFIGGETNQWAPALYDGVVRVEPSHDPDYHLTTDLANQAIAWVQFQQAMTPDKPFFIYFATGATHAPHHVPQEWADKYEGMFEMGWDRLREETLARQLELGVVPGRTQLTERPAEIPAWDSLSPERKRLFARQMEVFAGFAEHTDYEIGRLVQALEEMGELDNTLLFYIVGDNGASAEGGPDGTYNEILALNGIVSDISSQLQWMDEWGSPMTFPHFAVGWAHAGDTPFQWTKQVASHFGGTRNPMVVHWPGGGRPAPMGRCGRSSIT
jgi:arylsulfatase A-like enzyme